MHLVLSFTLCMHANNGSTVQMSQIIISVTVACVFVLVGVMLILGLLVYTIRTKMKTNRWYNCYALIFSKQHINCTIITYTIHTLPSSSIEGFEMKHATKNDEQVQDLVNVHCLAPIKYRLLLEHIMKHVCREQAIRYQTKLNNRYSL